MDPTEQRDTIEERAQTAESDAQQLADQVADMDTDLRAATAESDRLRTAFTVQAGQVTDWNRELHAALGLHDDGARTIADLIEQVRNTRLERDNLHGVIEGWRRSLTEGLQLSDAGEPMWSVINQACEELDGNRTDPTPTYPWTDTEQENS